MNSFLFVTICWIAAVLARPEPPVLYNGLNQQQQSINGYPSQQQQQHVYQQLPASQEPTYVNYVVPEMSYLPPSGPTSLPGPASVGVSDSSALTEDSYNTAHRLSSTPHASGYDNGPVETQIHKHIYVHVPPKDFEEEDAIRSRVHYQAGPKQKHYKIVFIKAPSAPAVLPPIVPPAPLNEEKTLIYVLHKKPEEAQDIIIPTAAPTKPSKPEVYFIKYKTKKEEAPVYGPPPQHQHNLPQITNEMEPRQGNVVLASETEDEKIADILPITTPTVEAHQQQQQQQQHQSLLGEIPSLTYGSPTTATYVAPTEEADLQTTLASPIGQYLPPDSSIASPPSPSAPSAHESMVMAPIIVQEEPEQPSRLPATNYGPPMRYYIKRKK